MVDKVKYWYQSWEAWGVLIAAVSAAIGGTALWFATHPLGVDFAVQSKIATFSVPNINFILSEPSTPGATAYYGSLAQLKQPFADPKKVGSPDQAIDFEKPITYLWFRITNEGIQTAVNTRLIIGGKGLCRIKHPDDELDPLKTYSKTVELGQLEIGDVWEVEIWEQPSVSTFEQQTVLLAHSINAQKISLPMQQMQTSFLSEVVVVAVTLAILSVIATVINKRKLENTTPAEV